MKWIWLQLLVMVIAGSLVVWADDFKRFEFQPFGGFTASGSIPLKADDDANHGSIQVNSSYNIGATFSINLNELVGQPADDGLRCSQPDRIICHVHGDGSLWKSRRLGVLKLASVRFPRYKFRNRLQREFHLELDSV